MKKQYSSEEEFLKDYDSSIYEKLSMTTLENNCPYSELWLFCSKGDGSLPQKAEDKDSNKIGTFLEMVSDFNNNLI